MQFIDRKAKYPGRWTMEKSDGTSEIVTLIRNDEPVVEGTPMNANTLNTLSDVAGADIAREKAEAAASFSEESKDAAASSENAARQSATAASTSAAEATRQAELAAQAAESKGFLYLEDNDNSGILSLVVSDNLTNDVTLQDNGRGILEVVYK